MSRIMVTGSGTGVGKTVVSAILTVMFTADYWKPIQCGDLDNCDTSTLKSWLDTEQCSIHAPSYSFKDPLSPHHAARLQGSRIEVDSILVPKTTRTLIIEGAGGVLVPLTNETLGIDLFTSWNCQWIIVSKHYLGSINHTLLTVEALKQRQVPILGIIFNGAPNPDSEAAILEISGLGCIGRLLPEKHINAQIIQRYATEWKPNFFQIFP